MPQVLVTEQYLEDIADAIRAKNGSGNTYTPAQMAGAIEDINTAGEVVLVQKTVNANGQYNASNDSADGYSRVMVNVPNSYSASDEGKVVSGGALVGQTSRNVTMNGIYDTTENNEVVVNVSGGESLDNNILRNGNFTINTTGVTQWDASNSGTSSSSRYPIVDEWEIMQCVAEKTAQGITITPSQSYAYLTQQINKWYVGKNVKLSVIVNGSEYNITGVLSASGTSLTLNTPFGQLYAYAYGWADIVYTLMFYNQIGNEFIITNAKVELA